MAITALDANGVQQTIETLPTAGRKVAAQSLPMAASTEDKAVADAQAASLVTIAGVVKAEDAAHASGDAGVMALVVRRDTAASGASADGDYATLNVDASGRLWVNVGTLAALPAGTNNIGDVDIASALPTGANIIGRVGIDQTTDGTTNKVVPSGNVAHDAADSGNPVKIGGKAYTTAPSAVANADRVDQSMTLYGAAHVNLRRADGTVIDPDEPSEVFVKSSEYETVAASQTDQMMGTTGAAGDKIEGILVIPATTSPGAISIEDGSTNTVVFAGGATSVADLKPFFIPLMGIESVTGGWEVTTGASVSCLVFGEFT